MTDSIELVDANPVVLVKQIVDAVNKGYYANLSIEGYPSLKSFPARIRMFKGERPAKRIGTSEASDNIVLESYEQVEWVLDIQDLVLQGFTVNTDSVVVGNLMACTMVRAEHVTEAPKAVVAEEVKEEVKPSPKKGRKPKSKEE